MPAQWLIIGCADDPRICGFISSLRDKGALAQSLDYLADWKEILPIMLNPETCLRIESPAYDLNVVRHMMVAGYDQAIETNYQGYRADAIEQTKLEQGVFLAPHQFYFGFRAFLLELETLLKKHPVASMMNHIPDIVCVYDKQQCHQLLAEKQISVPTALYNISCFEALMLAMDRTGINELFIKPRYGSGASGIIALRRRADTLHAITTIEEDAGIWFNTRKLQRLRGHKEIAPYIDKLARWGIHCEQWVPKLRINGWETDCRLLIVQGRADFAVLRKSRTPITNLHLLNQRSSISELHTILHRSAWTKIEATITQIAEIFPKSFHLAVDLAVHSNRRDHFVLEINAFGDFIQNISYQGMNSYQWQIKQFETYQQCR
jgi:hypothetical protein